MKRLGKAKSQLKDVLEYMQQHGSITSMEAFEYFHITRLASCIHLLRKYGYEIVTTPVHGRNEYGAYEYALYTMTE